MKRCLGIQLFQFNFLVVLEQDYSPSEINRKNLVGLESRMQNQFSIF